MISSRKAYVQVLFAALVVTLTVAVACIVEERQMGDASNGPRRWANRLGSEKSPYLLQHADNPVDWYPWGDEAFARAKQADKPILLSIGYSTCHWCHVMEHESFEDPEVADLMNQTFISIKVDREERPDIDNVYMTVCQMLTGSGGWPLTIVMTPDKVPFFAATYIPRETRFGRVGMVELVPRIRDLWITKRGEVLASAGRIASALSAISSPSPGEELDEGVLEAGYRQIADRFDTKHGGFGNAPKFPTPHNLFFLLRYWRRSGQRDALAMVERTLEAMRAGGIYDHVGFGFHRYSTDARWLVPHFEKMLYDQALLAMAYTEAYQATGKETYGVAAREILAYVLRDMTSPEGAFYSAEDADSEGREGKFYVWTAAEIDHVLGSADGALAKCIFNVKEEGNLAEEATQFGPGANILHITEPTDEMASEVGMTPAELGKQVKALREKLFTHRRGRIHPHKDDKVLTDWNGLMIAALAKAGQALGEASYTEAACRAADFLLDRMRPSDGTLFHRYRDGDAGIGANINDYAFLIWGLIEVYEASFETTYLKAALDLTETAIAGFWDDDAAGFHFTPDDGEELLVRSKEIYDGAIPSGNSVMMLNLLRLGRMTARDDYDKRAADIGRLFSQTVTKVPLGHTQLLVALDFAAGPTYEVVIAGDPDSHDTKAMVDALRSRFLPKKVVILRPPQGESEMTRLAAFTKPQTGIESKATAYVCRDYSCERPTTNIARMLELLAVK
jgi:uncharacterized protein YyaL (SSP411 family)